MGVGGAGLRLGDGGVGGGGSGVKGAMLGGSGLRGARRRRGTNAVGMVVRRVVRPGFVVGGGLGAALGRVV